MRMIPTDFSSSVSPQGKLCLWFYGDPRGVCEPPVTTGERLGEGWKGVSCQSQVSEQKWLQAWLYLKREPEREHVMFLWDHRILNSIKWINIRIYLCWYTLCLPDSVLFCPLCSLSLLTWSEKLVWKTGTSRGRNLRPWQGDFSSYQHRVTWLSCRQSLKSHLLKSCRECQSEHKIEIYLSSEPIVPLK